MIKEKIQSFMQSAGEYGCYALSIIKLAEMENGEHIDVIVALESGIEKGYIRFNYKNYSDPDNFYIEDAAKFLTLLTESVWLLKHIPGYVRPKDAERVIYRWERKTSKGVISHFRLDDWDSLESSLTVTTGKVASSRVFIKVG